jgi:hypothetical protein
MLTQIDLAGLPLMLTQFLTMTLRYRISQIRLTTLLVLAITLEKKQLKV